MGDANEEVKEKEDIKIPASENTQVDKQIETSKPDGEAAQAPEKEKETVKGKKGPCKHKKSPKKKSQKKAKVEESSSCEDSSSDSSSEEESEDFSDSSTEDDEDAKRKKKKKAKAKKAKKLKAKKKAAKMAKMNSSDSDSDSDDVTSSSEDEKAKSKKKRALKKKKQKKKSKKAEADDDGDSSEDAYTQQLAKLQTMRGLGSISRGTGITGLEGISHKKSKKKPGKRLVLTYLLFYITSAILKCPPPSSIPRVLSKTLFGTQQRDTLLRNLN